MLLNQVFIRTVSSFFLSIFMYLQNVVIHSDHTWIIEELCYDQNYDVLLKYF